jgi:hypothetical protein
LPSSDSGFGWSLIRAVHIARRFAQAATQSLADVELRDAMRSRIGMRDPFEAPS